MDFPDSLRGLLLERRWPDLLEGIGESPESPQARAARAFVLRALEREDEARSALATAVARDGPESPSAGLLREWLIADTRFDLLESLLPVREYATDEVESALLDAVRRHVSGDVRAAMSLSERVLAFAPDHPSAIAHRSRALHNLGSRADALDGFERAVAIDPMYCEGWHYLGIAARANRRMEQALQAFEHALELRPAFRAARTNLAKTLLAMEQSAAAYEVLVESRSRFPHDADIAADMGYALHRLTRLDEARAVLTEATRLDPGHARAWLYLGMVAGELDDRDIAESALRTASRLLPQDPEVWAELATFYETTNRLELVHDVVERGLNVAPGDPRLILEAARLKRRAGDPDSALRILGGVDCAMLASRQQRGYWYESGRNLDLLNHPDDAWPAFAEGNRLARADMNRQPSAGLDLLPLLDALAAQPPLPTRNRDAAESKRSPAFMLGFPRSGITLVNTMLACHPSVETLEERPTIESCVAWLNARDGGGYPDHLARISDSDADVLRALYWRAVAQHASSGWSKRALVDTFPLRTIHIALIRRLFPEARIIFVQRHPADVVLSNFMQDFAANAANLVFTDPAETAKAYATTLKIWRNHIPSEDQGVFYMRYEDLIRSPDKTIKPLLEFIGVAWDPSVLTGYRERAKRVRVGTSSYHQVAEALTDRSIGRWMHYRNQLAPILGELAPAAKMLGYSI